jgi:osmotically-inducible protein OsmY
MSEDAIVECIVAAAKDPHLKEADKGAAELIDKTVLIKKIETALLNSADLDYRPFTIDVEKGKVRVSGYIASEKEKKEAIRIVESVKGVKSVQEDIQVVNYKAYKDRT